MNTYDSQADLVSDKIRLDNVMNQASMPLQEWVSNNEYFNFLYQLAVPVTQNILGISWNPYTDNMNIVVGETLILEDSWRYTKRKTLSLVSSVFDPLGWVSPLTVRGKIFLQTLWKEKIGWDQTLNTEQVKVIRDILIDLQRVDEFSFPQHILHDHSELHVFTDASSRAYRAAVYTVNGVLRKLKHIFPNTYQRIKSICSPAKVGLVVTDLITSPVVSWRGWETPPPSTAAQLSFFA